MGEGGGLTCPTVHGECCEYTVPVSGISILELHSRSPEDYMSGAQSAYKGVRIQDVPRMKRLIIKFSNGSMLKQVLWVEDSKSRYR